MRVSDFHFDLPEELIAQHPPAERGASRMLVMELGAHGDSKLRDAQFRELPPSLRAGDLLVLNDSRVIPARLFARRVVKTAGEASQEPSGKIEVLLTEQIKDPKADESANIWRALVKPGRKVRVGERLEFFANDDSHGPVLTAEVIAAGERGERTLRFAPLSEPDTDFNAVLARIGHMPLPPYIRHGQDEAEDRERYQTVYSQEPGSAAAPTAGLHFTPEILDALRARGVEIAYLTLHVGLGTFQPVRVEEVKDIRLHSERYTLPSATADALKRALTEGWRIIAVGTTTTRTLEHIAREAGADAFSGSVPPERSSDGARDADWIARIAPHSGSTSIFIAPGHRFRIVSGLLTNFHLPESTLLMLISAFAADRIAQKHEILRSALGEQDADAGRRAVLAAYAHAVRERYRFFSYGDCMLLV
jgi:S-adenosylmethionine:tRNA ribosyltransferase-isomerase